MLLWVKARLVKGQRYWRIPSLKDSRSRLLSRAIELVQECRRWFSTNVEILGVNLANLVQMAAVLGGSCHIQWVRVRGRIHDFAGEKGGKWGLA